MNGPDVPTPVTDGTYLYLFNDRGIMWCLDAKTGRQIYGRQRLRSATYSASPVLADGKIYITDEDGVTSVVNTGPTFAVLAENDLGEYTLSSPAISDGQIFIRTDSYLYAIGQRRQAVVTGFGRQPVPGSSASAVVFGFRKPAVVSGFIDPPVVSGLSDSPVVSGFADPPVMSGFSRTVSKPVVSGFSRTVSKP
jgi:outer membrane protein assembly factor BamB